MKKKYYDGEKYEETEKYLKSIEKIEKKKYYVKVLGKKFVVYPSVFSPKYFRDSEFYVKELPVKKGEEMLEIGPGTGIVSIFAILKGASKVTAIDINPEAIKNTKENAKLHGVSDKIKVLKGDVFSPLKNEKFDVIFWNTPWGQVKKTNLSMIEKGLWDTEYEATGRFIKAAKNHLKPNGRLLIGFSSTIGDLNLLKTFLKEAGYKVRLVKKLKSVAVKYETNFEIFEAKLI